MNRLRFWWNVRRGRVLPRYDVTTGEGHVVEFYDPLSDLVTVRTSKFGCILGQRTMRRYEWDRLMSRDEWAVLRPRRPLK